MDFFRKRHDIEKIPSIFLQTYCSNYHFIIFDLFNASLERIPLQSIGKVQQSIINRFLFDRARVKNSLSQPLQFYLVILFDPWPLHLVLKLFLTRPFFFIINRIFYFAEILLIKFVAQVAPKKNGLKLKILQKQYIVKNAITEIQDEGYRKTWYQGVL